MSFLKTIKHRKLLIAYLVVSGLIFIISLYSLNCYDLNLDKEKRNILESQLNQSVFVVVFPITYAIIAGIVLIKYKEYRNHIKRYKSFTEYPKHFQE